MLRLIKLKEVIEITVLSRSSIYALAQKKEFPNPVKLSARSSAWVQSEVHDWVNERLAARDDKE